MTLWFILALMTIAAVFAVLWPLGRASGIGRSGRESEIYKDQLGEVERDLALGLIGSREAEAARIEVSRRLLAATEADQPAAPRPHLGARRALTILALIGLPVFSGAVYYQLGAPGLPSVPHAERASAPPAESLERLVAKVEAHLAKNPDDGRGWQVLAPSLMNLGRYDDAVKAYRNSIRINGDTATRRADLGEALMAIANGVVSAEAKAEFDRAVEIDPNEPKASYFRGVAAEQDGRPKDAALIWRKLLASASEDTPWRVVVERALARVDGGAKAEGPTEQEVAAAGDMSAGDREALVRAMVERLSARLKQDGSDPQGWLRLIRAYMVLGNNDMARTAASDARKALAAQTEALRALNDGLKSLGFDG